MLQRSAQNSYENYSAHMYKLSIYITAHVKPKFFQLDSKQARHMRLPHISSYNYGAK